ncbi:MAG TPA: CatA-like O-acetyltransferase [Saprospiraceae bacterium]|nr:CatA-like O-acetyltransferase [Saprospiraceae bacterium]
MKIIEFDNPHRKKHFAFFQAMEMPHFSMVSPIPVRPLHEFIRDHHLHFTGTMVYLISKVANEIREFRWRIRGDQVVEHELVHPSFTVNTDEADVFSFCYVNFTDDYHAFITSVSQAQKQMREAPSLEDIPDRDDYLFMSAMPWVHFTGFMHAMHTPVRDSVPRLTWGKVRQTGDELLMPVGVQAHHGVVDGKHVGMFYERFAECCAIPERSLMFNV